MKERKEGRGDEGEGGKSGGDEGEEGGWRGWEGGGWVHVCMHANKTHLPKKKKAGLANNVLAHTN